mmetsp:Transcript_84207/g.271553  ORF Transcript_84207/g.271553 Transcript_84207/m.271553 type:complete len:505 (-) Transcript_84207:43-1557(-)
MCEETPLMDVAARRLRPYDALGLPRSATPEDLRKAYRRAALQHHPDKGGQGSAFCRLVESFDALSDPTARLAYDHWLDADPGRADGAETQLQSGHAQGPQQAVGSRKRCCEVPGPVHDDQSAEPCKSRGTCSSGVGRARRRRLSAFDFWARVRREGSEGDEGDPSAGDTDDSHRPTTFGWDSGKFLEGVRRLLMRMDSVTRCKAIATSLSQQERLELEDWMLKKPRSDTGEGSSRPLSSAPISNHKGVHITATGFASGIFIFGLEIKSRVRPSLAEAVADHIVLVELREAVRISCQGGCVLNEALPLLLDTIFAKYDLQHRTVDDKEHRKPHPRSSHLCKSCLFLRYRANLQLLPRFSCNMRSPQYADVRKALVAQQRLAEAIGGWQNRRKLAYMTFASCTFTLEQVRHTALALYSEHGSSEEVMRKASLSFDKCENELLAYRSFRSQKLLAQLTDAWRQQREKSLKRKMCAEQQETAKRRRLLRAKMRWDNHAPTSVVLNLRW